MSKPYQPVYKMWAIHGTNYVPCEHAVETLPAGQYEPFYSESLGYYIHQRETNFDDLLMLPDGASEVIINDIKEFWESEPRYREFGFLWKRGIFLWGPPGGGKTCTLQLIDKMLIDQGGISVYITNPRIAIRVLEHLRRVEPTRPIIANLEDIDEIQKVHGEGDLLQLLDGPLQIDNIVFIATSNYPEKLNKRIINRPSRFDVIKKIGMPSPIARKVFLAAKNKRLAENYIDLKIWVNETKGFSIAHLKELIILVEVFNKPLDTAITHLRAMMNYHPKSSDDNDENKFGFITETQNGAQSADSNDVDSDNF